MLSKIFLICLNFSCFFDGIGIGIGISFKNICYKKVSVLVSKILLYKKSIGIGFEKFWYRKKYRYRFRKILVSKKVSVSVSKKIGIEKSIGIGFEKLWHQKSIGICFEKFWHQKKYRYQFRKIWYWKESEYYSLKCRQNLVQQNIRI